ncbi:Cleavage site for pathogenic type III effector avirulence factor Avr [Carex littledalei]|uniref:Cleavage site for pathogenic type III effector avirulence factor Avr n=1 Tax=Carex littledalei TaxID=544730 RepID=A0A833V881_9POAL|nr:Cleavage site for pathogenic type III effector avirulence factor Avr [Carex littledalei]
MAVPKFGGWDKKLGMPDYSMVFSRARANRKHQKSGARPTSFGNESNLLTYRHYDDHDDEPIKFKKKKKLLRYLCCIMV